MRELARCARAPLEITQNVLQLFFARDERVESADDPPHIAQENFFLHYDM